MSAAAAVPTVTRMAREVVTAMFAVPRRPTTNAERGQLAVHSLPRLLGEWLELSLPLRSTMYVLVFRPGQLGPSVEAATHRSDQVDGLVDELGGEGVAVALTDDCRGVEEFVAISVSGLAEEAAPTSGPQRRRRGADHH